MAKKRAKPTTGANVDTSFIIEKQRWLDPAYLTIPKPMSTISTVGTVTHKADSTLTRGGIKLNPF